MDYHSLILVVDDQLWGRQALASLLEPEGYRLTFAANGYEALACTAQLRPDLVLLDVMMSQMDGFEICRQLRADPRTAEIPLIMITALEDQESLLLGIEAGADDFVTKPFKRAELRARVRTITRLNRYRRLWEQRERYAQLVERSPIGVLIVDATGTIRMVNPALLQLMEAEAGAFLEQALAQAIVPDRRAEVADGLAALSAGMIERLHLETALVTGAGVRRPVDLDAGRCEWDTGPAVQVLIRDITDRKRADLLDIERRHIVCELHDGVAQSVTGLYQHLQLFARSHRPRSPAAVSALEQLQMMARRAADEIRRVLEGLRPSALDDFGLARALGMLVETMRDDGWDLTFEAQLGDQRLPAAVETALFRIAQEALTNSEKYAGERRAALSITQDDAVVRLEVRDWGPGFDPSALADSPVSGQRLGLRAMHERAGLLGGDLRVETGPGRGAVIIATIPLVGRLVTGAGDE
jgi:PAS domain S-box-containing protein